MDQLKPRTYAEADALLQAPGSIYEIEQLVIEGRKVKVWTKAPKSMREWMVEGLSRWADNEFVSEPLPEPAPASQRQSRTYGQVLDDAVTFASWLREGGIAMGDRVAIGGRNSSRFISAYVGTCLIGAVPVLLNTTLTDDNQVHCLTITLPKLVIGDVPMAKALASIAPTLASMGVTKLYCWDSIGHLDSGIRSVVSEYAPSPSSQTVATVRSGAGLDNQDPDSDAIILFTSGTTSKPKAVLLTHRMWCQQIYTASYTSARYAMRMGAPLEMALAMHIPEAKTCMLHAVPLFHVTGGGMLTRAIVVGQRLVFLRKWDVDTATALIRSEKVNNLMGVPALAAGLLASPRLTDELKLETVSFGGAPAPSNLAHRVQKQWNQALVVHLYGATEAAGLFTALVGADYIGNPTSAGLPTPILDMRVADPVTHKTLGPNEVGVIMFKGGSIMKEYLNNPKATAEAVDAEGWYNTGDVGYIDDGHGLLHITDREKDLIIRGGENIPSAEVENAAHRDERVLECAAIPVPCPVMTEQVGLAIRLVDGAQATPENLKAAMDPLLRPQARPVIIHVWDGPLPRNINGKILKNEIKNVVAEKWESKQDRGKL
ncbi:uncharacterized protein EHS24_008831 [Apiotrichum porosum]|uniref:AMP-dependent synthetase/ligase domain-containing protein n=1 Tax=Apiotrichum porosum TaxID=105984 RepID=A0A427XN86_9TREE|nr:uncharacterized protein EHS24_008831 [Apiotrichum porosum]RSH80258.1 hypothetical protein EHS24_008831 [Apiotrichum porosum]